MRYADWQARLITVVEEWRDEPFVWGKSDCVCFAAACVFELTGEDLMREFRVYDTEEGAQQVIRDAGYRSLYHMLTAILGRSIPATYAQRGDVVYRRASLEGGAVGICVGADALFKSYDGWARVKLRECSRAFRVS